MIMERVGGGPTLDGGGLRIFLSRGLSLQPS
jgi:hypothetical protein